jgi:integrase
VDYEAILTAYLRKRRNEKISDRTLKGDKDVLGRFIRFLNGREISEASIGGYLDYINDYTFTRNGKTRKYSKYTIYNIEATLKKFLNSVNSEFSSQIKPKLPNNKSISKKILDQGDIEKLLDVCLTNRDRALISFMYESGARKGEFLSIRLDNVVFDEMGAVVTIPEGKTGPRRIRVVFASSYLRQWIDTHPLKNDKEAFLFCSLDHPYGVLSFTGLRTQLDVLAERAGIGKKIYPHLFRHSRATHLAQHLTEQQLKVYLGWTAGSDMAATYVHLSGKDIDNAILKMNGIEIDDTHTDGLKVGRCPRCKELNPETSQYCGKCGLPLTEVITKEIDEDKTIMSVDAMKIALSDPIILEQLAERLRKVQTN